MIRQELGLDTRIHLIYTPNSPRHCSYKSIENDEEITRLMSYIDK